MERTDRRDDCCKKAEGKKDIWKQGRKKRRIVVRKPGKKDIQIEGSYKEIKMSI